MTAELHMLHLPLDMRRLLSFGHDQGLLSGNSPSDDGYLAHALLAAVFDDAAPKPFGLPSPGARERVRGRSDILPVLAYSTRTLSDIQATAQATADPSLYRVMDWENAADKPMPRLPEGSVIAFELRACPVTRLGRRATERNPGAEMDAFEAAAVSAQQAGTDVPDRYQVYLDWLHRQIDPAVAALRGPRIIAHRSVNLLRRSRPAGAGPRPIAALRRPDVTFTGELEVRDPDGFTRLLARGIGRHRAFGFGMLMLRRAHSLREA